MSFTAPLPSPDRSTGSPSSSHTVPVASSSSKGRPGPGIIFALPSPPLSQASISPSCVADPSDCSSSRRSPASNSIGSKLPVAHAANDDAPGSIDLDPSNRPQMYNFMLLDATRDDCDMAAEVIHLLIPGSGVHDGSLYDAAADQKLLAKYLLYWTSLTPHGLCILITTVVLIERLRKLHPGLSATGQIKDTVLRVVFSAYLAAMKLCTEVSYLNSAFEGRVPWSVREVNSMERELLLHLDFDCYVSAEQIIERANVFCHQRALAKARHFKDDGSADFEALLLGSGLSGANLFRHVSYSAAYA